MLEAQLVARSMRSVIFPLQAHACLVTYREQNTVPLLLHQASRGWEGFIPMLDIAPHEILHTLLQARAAVRDELGLLDRRPDSCTSRLIHLLECLEGLADASAQLITL
jgi:hypothetical protein